MVGLDRGLRPREALLILLGEACDDDRLDGLIVGLEVNALSRTATQGQRLSLISHEGDTNTLTGVLRLELKVSLAIRDEATLLPEDLNSHQRHRITILIIDGPAEDV